MADNMTYVTLQVEFREGDTAGCNDMRVTVMGLPQDHTERLAESVCAAVIAHLEATGKVVNLGKSSAGSMH